MNKYGDWVQFDGGTQQVKRLSSPVSGVPCTLFLEFRCTDFNAISGDGGATLWSFVETAAMTGYRLGFSSGRIPQAVAKAVGITNAASSSATINDNHRHTIIGEFASTTSRTVYFDNGSSGSNVTSTSPGALSWNVLGAYDDGTSVFGANHTQIGWAAAWSVADLSPDERQALADGVDPRLIRPQSLVTACYGGREVWRAAPFTVWKARNALAFEGGPRADEQIWLPWLGGFTPAAPLVGSLGQFDPELRVQAWF